MDPIKDSFQRVKQDISILDENISILERDLKYTKEKIFEIGKILEGFQEKINFLYEKMSFLDKTNTLSFQTEEFNNSTNKTDIKPLNGQIYRISTGNQGVQTDRQTDRQTDKQTEIPLKNPINSAAEILDSLDSLKKEIRLKFKRLTDQELLVFSTIFQLSEEKGSCNYKMLSEKLNLTESSIRDYVRRLIHKKIPVEKTKLNNKEIQLSISPDLKKITSLDTILKLREI